MSKIEVDQVDPQSGTTLTLGTSGDTVSIPSGVTLANAGTATGFASIAWQSSIVTAATLTAEAGKGYWIDTSSNACTVTFPGSASVGDRIILTDYARNWGTNSVTINQNSLNFQGHTSPNPEYDTSGQSVDVVYSGATKGWIPNSDDVVEFETSQFSGSTFYLVLAGGGGGGTERGGGGGAGGYLTNFGGSAITLQQSTTYTVTVGTGGAGAPISPQGQGTNGQNSVLSGTGITTITTNGGGGGGGSNPNQAGLTGGSGGGAMEANPGAAGNTPSTTPSQGNNGGAGAQGTPYYGSGGGGGAGAVGVDGTTSKGGNGGAGAANSITGSSVTYGGGGGGGVYNSIANIGVGGTGGGGNGGSGGNGSQNIAATDGTDGLGGGGGGGARQGGYTSKAGDGGNGLVILRMLTSDYNLKTGITGTHSASADGSDTVVSWTASGSISF